MQLRNRRSSIWAVPLLAAALAGWASQPAAAAGGREGPPPCAPAWADVAALATPEWAAQETTTPAMGTEAPPPAMGSETPDTETPSGPPCTAPGKCRDPKQFCATRPGRCAGTGTCVLRPKICTRIYKPVCGCNAKTYSNACEAAAAGINIRYDGKCKAKKPAKPAGTYKSTP